MPERIAMAISDHKTRSIFDRYNITGESDLTKDAQALDAYHGPMQSISGEIAEQIIKGSPKGLSIYIVR